MKVLSLGSALTDTTAEAPMRKTTEEEFAALKGTMKEKDYKNSCRRKIWTAHYLRIQD